MSFAFTPNSGYFGGGGNLSNTYDAPFRGGASDNNAYGDFNSGYKGTMNNIDHAKNYQPVLCSQHEFPVYQICLDKNCPHFFELACEKCPDENHSHSVQKMGYLQTILVKWAELTQNANPELQNYMPTAIYDFQNQLIKNIDDTVEKFTKIKAEILQKIEEFYPKKNPKYMIKEYLKDIFNNPFDNYLKENILRIKKLVEVDENKNITILESNSSKGAKFQQSHLYLNKLNNIVKTVNEQVDSLQKESQDLSSQNLLQPWMRGQMEYHLVKGNAYNSQNIKEIFKGTVYEATHEGYQILFSQKYFATGKHIMYVKMESINYSGYSNIFYVGIIKQTQDMINSKQYNGAINDNGCRKCLFNADQQNQMHMVKNKLKAESMNQLLEDQDILTFDLDIDEGIFQVSLQKKGETYIYRSNEELKEMIKANQWRFVIEFYNCDSKIRLLASS